MTIKFDVTVDGSIGSLNATFKIRPFSDVLMIRGEIVSAIEKVSAKATSDLPSIEVIAPLGIVVE